MEEEFLDDDNHGHPSILTLKDIQDHLQGAQQAAYEYLKERMPKLQQLAQQEVFESFELVRARIGDRITGLDFDVKAPSLFPYVRRELINRNIANSHSILHQGITDKGEPNEIYKVTLGFYRNFIQITLNFKK